MRSWLAIRSDRKPRWRVARPTTSDSSSVNRGCPIRASVARVGPFAKCNRIADHLHPQRHSHPLTPSARPLRFNLHRAFFPGRVVALNKSPKGTAYLSPAFQRWVAMGKKAESRQGRHMNPGLLFRTDRIRRVSYNVPKGTREENIRLPSVETLGLDMSRLRRWCVIYWARIRSIKPSHTLNSAVRE